MGVVSLTVITMVNMIGSGIILLPSQLAQVGAISLLSWVVTSLGALALAYAFAKSGRYSKNVGGLGGYAQYGFGKGGNFITNYTYGFSLVIANVAIATTTVGYIDGFMGWNLSPIMTCVACIIVVWLSTVLNFWGPRVTGRIGSITVWGIIIPVVGLCIIGWFWFSGETFVAAWNPHNNTFGSAITSSLAITLWAFLGLESASANADAVENPNRNVPIACLVATIGTAVIYIGSTAVAQGIVPNAELAASTAPFGLVFVKMFNGTVGQIVEALMIIACFGSLLAWQFTVAQVFRSSAMLGYFPKWFNKITKHNAPVLGMTILAVVQTALTLMTISPNLNKQFNMVVDLAVVPNVVAYILAVAAVPAILRSAGVIKGTEYKLATWISWIALLYSFYAYYASGTMAVMWGSIFTFLGFVIFAYLVARRISGSDNAQAVQWVGKFEEIPTDDD